MSGLLELPVGKLLLRYLEVPLTSITIRLPYKDCKPIIAKISARIYPWTEKNSSFGGRIQLINLVLDSVQVFWSSLFILTKRVIIGIEQKLNASQWTGKDGKTYCG